MREGGSVVEVVVAVHHRRMEDRGEEEKRNSWHFTAASRWQRKESCLPTSRKKTKDSSRGEPKEQRIVGYVKPGTVSKAARPILRDNLLIIKSDKGHVITFSFTFTPWSDMIFLSLIYISFLSVILGSSLDYSSTFLTLNYVFISKQLLAQLSSFSLCSLDWFGAVADSRPHPQAEALRLER